MEIGKVPPPDYHPVEYASFIMNLGRNLGEILMGYKLDKGLLIPVYFRRESAAGSAEFSAWSIRTFRAEYPYHFESAGPFGLEKRMIWDNPKLLSELEVFVCPDNDKFSGGRQAIIKRWEALDEKKLTIEELKDWLGIPN